MKSWTAARNPSCPYGDNRQESIYLCRLVIFWAEKLLPLQERNLAIQNSVSKTKIRSRPILMSKQEMGWDAWWTYVENIRPDHIPSMCSVPDVVIEDWFVPKKDFVFMKIRKLLCLTCNCRCSLGWRRLPSLDTATPCNRTTIICNLNTLSTNLSMIEYVFIYGLKPHLGVSENSWLTETVLKNSSIELTIASFRSW